MAFIRFAASILLLYPDSIDLVGERIRGLSPNLLCLFVCQVQAFIEAEGRLPRQRLPQLSIGESNGLEL